MTLNHLSLFSGYEGFGLGLKLAGVPIRTVGYVEIDQYCQKVIQQRIRDGFLDDAYIWLDVRDFPGYLFAGKVGILTAGFPCQPHSVAGKQRGADDERNLWPDTLRIVGEVGPRWLLLENVPGILANGYAGTVVGQLSEIGYDCKWGVVSAADVGANHLRKRWWVLANASGGGCRETGQQRGMASIQRRGSNNTGSFAESGSDVADAAGRQDHERGRGNVVEASSQGGRINPASGLGGEYVADAESECGTLWPAEGERQRRPAGCGAVANAEESGLEGDRASEFREGLTGLECGGLDVADADSKRQQAGGPTRGPGIPFGDPENNSPEVKGSGYGAIGDWWQVEPSLGRVVDGCPDRVGQLRALGGGIVPAVVKEFRRQLER